MWIYVVLGTWNAFCVGSENGFFSDLAPGTGTFLGACVLFPEMWTGTAYAPSVGSGCDCDPFGILLQYKSTRKRLCNNFREGGNRAFTADICKVLSPHGEAVGRVRRQRERGESKHG